MNKLLLIVLFAILALGFADKCPVNKLVPGKCNCLPKVKSVCGASSKTHVNKCIAKCFGDVVVYDGKCFKKCPVTNTTSTKCSVMPFGKFGIRKYCCSSNSRCFGKICSRSNFSCVFNGPVISTFPKRSCKWTKRGKDYTKKCCTWKRRCVGEVCKNSKKNCQFKGKIMRRSVKQTCSWRKSPQCGTGLQKYCCKHARKCVLGGKCTTPKKVSCKFVGPVIRRKVTKSCKWTKVGKHGQRRQCCVTVSKCKGSRCTKGKKQCKWIGWVYITKQIKKCGSRKYGKATRKRCCVWKIRCYNKKCTTVNKSCGWAGNAVSIKTGKTCKFSARGKGKKQMRCCTFKKRCVNAKCRTFAKKCKWTGKVVRATSVRKCALVYVAKAKASRRKCCSFDRICDKKCVLKNKKCTFTGPFIQTKLMKKCQWKKISKVASCKFCCQWHHGCTGKICQSTKKICRCATTPVFRSRVHKCTMKRKTKKTVQKQCCDYIQTCFAGVGKSCKAGKKTCHWVGFPVVTSASQYCLWKTRKGLKQQFCCTVTTKCHGGKCSKVKACKWTGKVVVNIQRKKCSFKTKEGNVKQKFCCSWTEQCDGPRCKKLPKTCGFVGPIYQVWKYNYKTKKACGPAKKGKRTFRCSKKKICVNAQPKTCDPNVTKCLKCKFTKPKCRAVGKCTTISFKVEITHRSRGKGVKQPWKCTSATICRNGICKPYHKKCGFVGVATTTSVRITCTWRKDIKSKKERKFCCKEKTRCTGKVCKRVGKVCAYTGPWRALRKHVVCKYVPFRTVKKNACSTTYLRKQCCHYTKKCVNNKCTLQSKKCKFYAIIERTPKRKCVWKVISGKKCNTFKQKVCTSWTKVCKKSSKNAKKICKKEGLKIVTIKNASVRVSCKTKCAMKFFGDCQKRKRCCTKQTVCYGEKCHSFVKKCVWRGAPTKCCKGLVVFRWRTMCRETKLKNTKTREQCCRVYQRCEKVTNYYRCAVVKKRGCWWTGAARGDVHLLGLDGKWRTMNVAGTFRYLTDKKSNLNVYLQFRQVGSGSETSAITVRADGSLVQAFGGKVFVNGKETTVFPAAVGKGKLVKGKSALILKGFSSERIAFVRQADGSYTVDVGIKAGKGTKFNGLIKSLANPIRYQITADQSKALFAEFIPFKQIVLSRKVTKAHAEKCCAPVKVLDAKRYEQCVSDALASGKCYVKTYLKSNQAIKEELTKK